MPEDEIGNGISSKTAFVAPNSGSEPPATSRVSPSVSLASSVDSSSGSSNSRPTSPLRIPEDKHTDNSTINSLLTPEILITAFSKILNAEYNKIFNDSLTSESLPIATDLLSLQEITQLSTEQARADITVLLNNQYTSNELEEAFKLSNKNTLSTEELAKNLLEKIITDEQALINSESSIWGKYPHCNLQLLAGLKKNRKAAEQLAQHTNQIIKTICATENHANINQAITLLLLDFAKPAAANLFKTHDFSDLTNFENKLNKTIEGLSEEIISFLINLTTSKSSIILIIKQLNTLTPPIIYLDALKNTLPTIIEKLHVKNLAIRTYIEQIAENTLLEACTDYFLTEQTKPRIEMTIKSEFAENMTALNLTPEDHEPTLSKLTSGLTAKILIKDHIKETINLAKEQDSVFDQQNLIQLTEKLLTQQQTETIKSLIQNNFSFAVIDSILKKINLSERLTAAEIAKVSSLQYTETQEEFCVVLQALGCSKNTIAHYQESDADQKIARIRNEIRQFFVDEEDSDLNELSTKEWLEKRLQVKTKHAVSLKLDKKEQAIIAKQFKAIQLLPELDHYVISSLSPDKLLDEIAKRQTLKAQLISASLVGYAEIDKHWQEDYSDLMIFDADKFKRECVLTDTQNTTFENIVNAINETSITPIKRRLIFPYSDYIPALKQLVNETNQKEGNDDQLSREQLTQFIGHLITSNSKQFKKNVDSRKSYESETRVLYGLIDKIKVYREALSQQQQLLESMQVLQKDVPLKEHAVYQPGESYLPLRCRELPDENGNLQDSDILAVTAQGGAFSKQNEIIDQGRVRYEQNLGHEKKIWSITRQKNTLEYRNEKKSFWSSATVSLDVARAQILDIMNRYKDKDDKSNIVTININHCNKESERNYRLVIRAYNERNTGRQISCIENKEITMQSTKLAQEVGKLSDIQDLQPKISNSIVNKIQEVATDKNTSIRRRGLGR